MRYIYKFSYYAANDESPFPSKPALARSATRRPTKRVPPIAAAQSERFSSKEDDQDSAYEDSLERGLFDESKSEVKLTSPSSSISYVALFLAIY